MRAVVAYFILVSWCEIPATVYAQAVLSMETVIFRTMKVTDSNIGPETGYFDWEFHVFPQSLQSHYWNSSILILTTIVSFKILPNSSNSHPQHPTVSLHNLCTWKMSWKEAKISRRKWDLCHCWAEPRCIVQLCVSCIWFRFISYAEGWCISHS